LEFQVSRRSPHGRPDALRSGFSQPISYHGKENVSKVLISDIKPGQDVNTSFVVQEKELRKTRNGKPFLSLKLVDKSGVMVGRIWSGAEEMAGSIPCQGVVAVQGRAELFRDELQLHVQTIHSLSLQDIEPQDFMPASPHDTGVLFQELRQILKTFKRKPLQLLVKHMLADLQLMEKFRRAPAAKAMHHAYLGGLLEHTLGVCRVVSTMADHYSFLDREMLLAGAFLHDMGKVDEFSYELFIDYSHAGRLVGHMVLGVQILEEKIRNIKNFPQQDALLLKHLVLSHHGETALGAVKLPMTREALVLHFADDLDAKMNSVSRILDDDKGGNEHWTSYQPLFERFFLRELPAHSPAHSHVSALADTKTGGDKGGENAVQLHLWKDIKNH